MNKSFRILPVLVILIVLIASCASAPAAVQDSRITVSVSVLPEKYFVERIGGDYVEINVMVGPGDSPHSYEPKASQMAAVSKSAIYFSIGVEFEDAWMERIASTNSEMRIVDLTRGITRIPSIADHKEDADHELAETGDEGDDQHGGEMDPHIWTSPANAAIIAKTVTQALAAVDPGNAAVYQVNLQSLLADISVLQDEISTALENIDHRKFMVFHPAWGYFAQEFGLEQIPIEAGGSEPSARELTDLIASAKSENIRVIFAQPEFSTRSAEYIASEINGKVILISPLAEHWLDNLRQVADIIAEEL